MKNKQKNRHHLKAKALGGERLDSNMLTIDVDKHNAWHTLFGLMTPLEIIRLLVRMLRMKHNRGYEKAYKILQELEDEQT